MKKKKRPNKLYREGVQIVAWVDENDHAILRENEVNISEIVRSAISFAAHSLRKRRA